MSNRLPPPQATIRRLSIYLRSLNSLYETGTRLVSSQELAEFLDLNPAQVRKDLAYFGEFGKRGVGYTISRLRDHLIEILGLTARRMVGIVGAGGRLGHALALYKGFEKRNFNVVALFDNDPLILNQDWGDAGPIRHISALPDVVRELNIEILILTVPAEAVKEVFDYILQSGVKAVLNFAPIKLTSNKVRIHNVDLAIELESLSYYLGGTSKPPDETV
ncbi:MAG: redox-sensing transcriptional repressor Rex [Candidatus Riflebacteria bacterium]|nr:redox-sensing transcriptional repressor Rex [Candidatus Riflebacteria bacterium]